MIGRPATAIIGLGRLSVSGRRRTPWPPAMMTAQFVRIDGLQELLEQVQADGTAVGVDDGDRIDAAGAHELQCGRAAIAGGHGQIAAGQDGRDGVLETSFRPGARGAGRRP